MRQKTSVFKTAICVLYIFLSLVLFFTFGTCEVTSIDKIPLKFIILSFLLLISLMIIVCLQNFTNKFILASQIYFLLCVLVLFFTIEKNWDNTQYILLRIILILIIAMPIYPFVPIILLIENLLFNIGITNEFLTFLIWIILLDILVLISSCFSRVRYNKQCKKYKST